MGQADTLDLITKKMPTGISSLDPVMEGGIPPGSLVLLLGEIGSGSSEFIYTSVLSLSRIMSPNPADESILLPESIRYVTFTKLSDDVKREMVLTFKPDFLGSVDTIRFEDLSQLYFDSTVVPVDWYCKGDIISRLQNRSNRDMLAHLSETLALGKQNSLIVLDSFTDLATQSVGQIAGAT